MQGNKTQVEDTDGSVVQKCLSGNPDAYEELVVRYQKPVYNLAYRMLGNTEDAKDITQEAFVKAYQSLHRYNSDYSFRSWIFRITQNLSIYYLRWKKRRPQTSLDEPLGNEMESEDETLHMQIADSSPNARTMLMEEQKTKRIEQIIQSLPEKYLTVIILRHIQGLQIDEIANVLEIPEGTVKVNLYRARNLMKEKLGDLS